MDRQKLRIARITIAEHERTIRLLYEELDNSRLKNKKLDKENAALIARNIRLEADNHGLVCRLNAKVLSLL